MACHLSRALRSLCNPNHSSRFLFPSPFASLPFSSAPLPAQNPLFSGSTPSPLPLQSSSSIAEVSQAVPFLCGRGDKKTKKGKRFRHRFGNPRPNREHQIRRIRERWEQPPGTPWPVPGLSVEDYRPIF